jgi:tetratricopeptide (TPR) repeat protein
LLRFIYIGPEALALPVLLFALCAGQALYNFSRDQSRTGHGGALILGGLCAATWLAPGMPAATATQVALPCVVLVIGLAEGWRTLRLRAAGSLAGDRMRSRGFQFVIYVGLACPMTPVLYLPARVLSYFSSMERDLSINRGIDSEDLARPPVTSVVILSVALCVVFAGTFAGSRSLLQAAAGAPETVDVMLADGRADEALKVATLAVERKPLDPDRHYLRARTALAAEGVDAAQAELARLFGLNRRPNPAFDPLRPEQAPRWIDTTRPFVHLPGRLLEADLYRREDHHPLAAASALVLAQSFGRALPESRAETICDVFVTTGAQQRGLPACIAAGHLTNHLPRDAWHAACVGLAARGLWEQCLTIALGWQEKAPDTAAPQFWVGRARLALGQKDQAVAELRRAMMRDHPDAPWFLGVTLLEEEPARAEEILLRTLQGSLFRTASVALAIQSAEKRLQDLDAGHPDVPSLERSLQDYHAALDRLMNQELPVTAQFVQEDSGARLLALDPRPPAGADLHYAAGVLWTLDTGVPQDAPMIEVDYTDPQQPWVRDGNRVLEVRWVEDLVPFGGFDWNNPADEQVLPGWPDAYARLRNLRSLRAARQVETEAGERVLEITSPGEDAVAMVRSTYLPVSDDREYVFGARCRSKMARLVAGWEWYGENEAPLATANLFNQLDLPQWKWRARFLTPPPGARSVRLHAGIYEDAGAAQFDRIQFFALSPRSPGRASE